MFWPIVWFEIRYWLRSWMLWICLLVICSLTIGAVCSDQIVVGLGLSNIYRNSPFVLATFYSSVGVFTPLMIAAIVNFAALRDFSHNTHQIVYSTPLSRRDLVLGRFLGASVVAAIPMAGVSLGLLGARYLPGADPAQWEPVNWTPHGLNVLLFAIPDTFFVAGILFAAAIYWRKEVASFVAAIVLFAGYAITGQLLQNPQSEHLRALFDPFGVRTLQVVSKYWTVVEKNSVSTGFSGLLLENRLMWIALACVALTCAYFRFSFHERRPKRVAAKTVAAPPLSPQAARLTELSHSAWAKLRGTFKIHFEGMARNTAFLVVALVAGVICIFALSVNDTFLNNHSFPVTYQLIELTRGNLSLFLIIVVAYFSGALVWKDREERLDEIVDATPTPEWVSYAARLGTLIAMVMLLESLALLAAVIDQLAHGYHRFQWDLYVHELLVRDASWYLLMVILAFFIHALAPNKYVGYLVFIGFYCLNTLVWKPLNVATNLVQYGGRPTVVSSDFFGDAPYRTAWNWFTAYWLLFGVLLMIATVMFWPRGKADGWSARGRLAVLRFGAGPRIAAVLAGLAFVGCGGWIFYNTEILNRLVGPKELERVAADYEKTYKHGPEQPRVVNVQYQIEVFPTTRALTLHADETIRNGYSHPLEEIHFSLDPLYDTTIEVPGAVLTKDDRRLSFRSFRFTSPLQPGETRQLHFTVTSRNRGFENNVTNISLVQNGTFFSNLIVPVIGYNYLRELSEPAARKKAGLPEVDLMPSLVRDCTTACRDTYLPGSSDWVDVTTIISTASDEIAIAPGSLIREWRDKDRRFFEYRLDHPSLNFLGFVSGRYEVAREDWNGIKLEVYYLKEHPWNVPRMMDSMKQSLGYYTRNFGPYAHKEARVVEFPRVADFAQSFPSTMPYSESLGFIANLNHPDDIDSVFYAVAHEMAHQWWANQVAGANMEGATLLSEGLAQYSSLMVMEKAYGRDLMRKFLSYAMDGYLRSRGQERLRERPLISVEYQQGYIHYQKSGVVLYYLKEMIGEEAVNRALHKLVQRYAYAGPPYPTSYALLDALREETPPNLQYLLKDLLEDITLFSNRTLEATAVRRSDGQYDVNIKTESHKFKADATGNEAEVPMNDWIDIGAFAKPAPDHMYGATLYRERFQVTQRLSTFKFVTKQLPEKAGIDPFTLLIDRAPEANTKIVTLAPEAPPGG